jgi:hypothetical protein
MKQLNIFMITAKNRFRTVCHLWASQTKIKITGIYPNEKVLFDSFSFRSFCTKATS